MVLNEIFIKFLPLIFFIVSYYAHYIVLSRALKSAYISRAAGSGGGAGEGALAPLAFANLST